MYFGITLLVLPQLLQWLQSRIQLFLFPKEHNILLQLMGGHVLWSSIINVLCGIKDVCVEVEEMAIDYQYFVS